jgi:hypothetical protein
MRNLDKTVAWVSGGGTGTATETCDIGLANGTGIGTQGEGLHANLPPLWWQQNCSRLP